MTPPGSVLISAYIHRGLAYEAKGDYEHAKAGFQRHARRRRLGRRQQGQSGHRKGAAVAAVGPGRARRAAAANRAIGPAADGDTDASATAGLQSGSASGRGGKPKRRPPRRAGDRQRRLCQRQGAAQSAQRRALDRAEPARHRLRGDRRHRSRSRGDAEDDPRFPARSGARAGRGGLLRRPRRADRRPQLPGAGRRATAGRRQFHRRRWSTWIPSWRLSTIRSAPTF